METFDPKPRHCWFRYSLRALFVVVTLLAIPLGWLGWQVRVVHARRALLAEIDVSGTAIYLYERPLPPQWNNRPTGLVLWIREWLGDEQRMMHCVPWTETDDRAVAARRLFPETYFFYSASVTPSASQADQP